MKAKEILTGDEIREIKEMARDARKQFGIAQDAIFACRDWALERYRVQGDKIDFMKFMDEVYRNIILRRSGGSIKWKIIFSLEGEEIFHISDGDTAVCL